MSYSDISHIYYNDRFRFFSWNSFIYSSFKMPIFLLFFSIIVIFTKFFNINGFQHFLWITLLDILQTKCLYKTWFSFLFQSFWSSKGYFFRQNNFIRYSIPFSDSLPHKYHFSNFFSRNISFSHFSAEMSIFISLRQKFIFQIYLIQNVLQAKFNFQAFSRKKSFFKSSLL